MWLFHQHFLCRSNSANDHWRMATSCRRDYKHYCFSYLRNSDGHGFRSNFQLTLNSQLPALYGTFLGHKFLVTLCKFLLLCSRIQIRGWDCEICRRVLSIRLYLSRGNWYLHQAYEGHRECNDSHVRVYSSNPKSLS